jgi:hypothetical protein
MKKIQNSNIDGNAGLGRRPRSMVALKHYSLTVHHNQSVSRRPCGDKATLVFEPRLLKLWAIRLQRGWINASQDEAMLCLSWIKWGHDFLPADL